MANVTYNNLVSEPRNNILSLISDPNNVSDPATSSSEFRKWIYSRMPDVKDSDFSGYPVIIVGSTNPEIDEDEGSGNGRSKYVDLTIDIEVVTSDRGYGENNGKGLTHMESISNDIYETLLDVGNRGTLRNFGMSKIKMSSTIVEVKSERNELVYHRILTVSFRNRLKVSA